MRSRRGDPTRSGVWRASPHHRFASIAILLLFGLLGSIRVAKAEDPAIELARLRREVAEKNQVIERLNAELAARGGSPPQASPATSPPPTPDPSPPVWDVEQAEPMVPSLVLSNSAIPPPSSDALLTGTRLFDNLSIFAGLDGSKQPQDFGVNALFGGRVDVNLGLPLFREYGVGVQLGTSLNYSQDAVQVFERIQGTKRRYQNFTTVGVYQRTDSGFYWGVGYDFLYEQYFNNFSLGQWRGKAGYALDDRNEIGARLMLRGYGANGSFGKTPVTLNPIDMGTLYFSHTWASGASTGVWLGLADRHNEPNIALGDAGPVRHPFVYGFDLSAPLNDHIVLFGQANFITPPSTGTVDAVLGFAYYPVARSVRLRSKQFNPVLPVANNPTFAVDLGRRR
jgi:hypothetical protein